MLLQLWGAAAGTGAVDDDNFACCIILKDDKKEGALTHVQNILQGSIICTHCILLLYYSVFDDDDLIEMGSI